LVTGEQTGKRYAVTEVQFGPGSGLGRHKHLNFDETNLVIEGNLRGTIGDKPFTAGPGDIVQIPRNVLHVTENASLEEPVTSVVSYTPSGMDEYFQKFAEALENGQLARGGREALQKEYGVVFEGQFLTQRTS
jgi:quercetin dioxygenase-like cupin family protein